MPCTVSKQLNKQLMQMMELLLHPRLIRFYIAHDKKSLFLQTTVIFICLYLLIRIKLLKVLWIFIRLMLWKWIWSSKELNNLHILTNWKANGRKQSRFSACELTMNCMSLSLLEVDLGKKALEAGKQTNPTVNKTTQENLCLTETQL